MTVVRVKIDALAGSVELEGDREAVSNYLDKLLPFIGAAGFGTTTRAANGAGVEAVEAQCEAEPEANGTPEAKKKRRVVERPPAGASCGERILVLRRDGFFKAHRSVSDIVGGLAKKGWTHKSNQVGAALTRMFNRGEIQRTKGGDGTNFDYYWDRD